MQHVSPGEEPVGSEGAANTNTTATSTTTTKGNKVNPVGSKSPVRTGAALTVNRDGDDLDVPDRLPAIAGSGSGAFRYRKMNAALEGLLKNLRFHQVGGSTVSLANSSDWNVELNHDSSDPPVDGQEFQQGWPKFVDLVAHVLSPPVMESGEVTDIAVLRPTAARNSSNDKQFDEAIEEAWEVQSLHGLDGAIRDMAVLLGSCSAPHNNQLQSLEELMRMMCDDSCDDFIRLMGLNVVRACIYINPDKPNSSDKEQLREYIR